MNLFFSCLVIRLLLCQKLLCQNNIIKSRILWKKIEGLEHQPEVKPFLTDLLFLLGRRICRIKQSLSIDTNDSTIRSLQEIQAAQHGRLTAAGRTDDRQHLTLLQRKTDVF